MNYISDSVHSLDGIDLNKVFFTSDNHFHHANIIKFCNRPFGSVTEMDAAMIANWNKKVPLDGIVYHLGDFTLEGSSLASQYFEALNGTIKILANPWHHDGRWLQWAADNPKMPFRTFDQWGMVEILPPLVVLEVSRSGSPHPHAVVLCHYPLAEWDRKHYGAWHLHGHSHGRYKYLNGESAMDVGVDSCNFHPVSYGDVFEYMEVTNGK